MLTEKQNTLFNFEEIYVSYFSRMKCFAQEYVLSEEDSENIVQDVFTDLWERRGLLPYDINLVAFLFMSIKNRCIDHLRHKVIARDAMNMIQEEYQATLRVKLCSLELFNQSLFSEQDIEGIITDLINSLPEKCRTIFIKSKMEGKKQKEIAIELNVTLKTVENQMNIAYKKIKTKLQGYLSLLFLFLNY